LRDEFSKFLLANKVQLELLLLDMPAVVAAERLSLIPQHQRFSWPLVAVAELRRETPLMYQLKQA